MNIHLAPTHKALFDNHWLLWFSKSNSYTVIDNGFNIILDFYFEANNIITFESLIQKNGIELTDSIEATVNGISTYLSNCNITANASKSHDIEINKTKLKHTKFIKVYDKVIQLNFDIDLVLKTIFPALFHLECSSKSKPDIVFDFYLDDEHLLMFQDGLCIIKAPKLDYHLLQGKFIFRLLCFIHNKTESDWIGTFHGCTIANGSDSVLITGHSGKGKSTLSTLLASSGYEMVADDVSPLLESDLNLYQNPAAVSIKKGSFDILKSSVSNFENLPEVNFNPSKGTLKYVPFSNPKKRHYPCKAIVLVNYKHGEETKLEDTSIDNVLLAFMADSWFSPNPKHAKLLIEWLKTLKFKTLTYSNNANAIKAINQLFKS